MATTAALDSIRLETETRAMRATPIEVLDNQLAETLDLHGSIVVFVARKGSPALALVRKAAAGDAGAFEQCSELAAAQSKAGKRLGTDAFAREAIKSPVLGEVRYAGTTLNSAIFLPKGVELAPVLLPYNGGALADEGFVLVEHVKDDDDAGLAAVAIRTPPKLTKAERAAVVRVPRNQRSKNVGSAMSCETTAWAVVAVVVAGATLVAALIGIRPAPEQTLSDRDIKRIGPHASARRILALRRKVLAARLKRGRRKKAPGRGTR